jgi:hypothetical protein
MHASPDAELATTPILGAVTGAGLADRLARAYGGRLAPAFVRRVLRDEQRRDPTRPDDVIERAVRRRLDAWLAGGRYPLTDDDEGTHYPDSSSGALPAHARGRCSRDE